MCDGWELLTHFSLVLQESLDPFGSLVSDEEPGRAGGGVGGAAEVS